jgi:hypothetical protein
MFSKYNGGITNIFPNETIDLLSVSHLIKNNPEKDKILEIRDLRTRNLKDARGNDLYKVKKEKLSYLTVNAVLRKRSLKETEEFESNFMFPSGYIYLDFDRKDITKTPEFKRQFIEMYGDKVSLVSYSSSMGGISVFVKYSGVCFKSELEYEVLRNYIIETHFTKIKSEIDSNTEGIGQCWYIPIDENPYENYSNVIIIPPTIFDHLNNKSNTAKKTPDRIVEGKNQYKMKGGINITLDYTNKPTINEVISNTKWSTNVKIDKDVVEIKEIDFNKLFIPRFIPDGKKIKTFTSIFANFIELNPDLPIEYVITLLNHINYNNTGSEPMSNDNFKKVIDGLIRSYRSGKLYSTSKKKHVHFNKNASLSKNQKIGIANKLNGSIRRNRSILKIINAKKELEEIGEEVTKSKVIKLTNLSKRTVYDYWDWNPINIDDILGEINSKEYGS